MTGLFAAITGSQVDSENGIIRGVSVITVGEAKGHGVFADKTTLSTVKAAADQFSAGVKVKINHRTGVEAIVGFLKNFRIEGDQLRADLHLLRTAPDFARILELAATIPDTFGLSISFSGTREKIGDQEFARCTELYSVDIVDEPAANPSGLFSKVDTDEKVNMTDEKSFLEKLTGLFSKAEQLSTAQTEANKLKIELEAKGGELSKAQDKIVSLEAAAAKLDADHKAALAAKDAEVETKAAAKALEISASQGIQLGKIKTDKVAGSDEKNLTQKCLKANGKL